MTENEVEEYKALRATIRERGSVRTCVFVAGIAAWALVALAATFVAIPLMAVLPLILLAGTFEAVFALHVGVERIGRYLQVFYEDRWEQTAMAFGPPLAGTGSDPLFATIFGLATMGNLAPVLAAAAGARRARRRRRRPRAVSHPSGRRPPRRQPATGGGPRAISAD